jgi:spermidine/putrescine transport system substrate-binding protein
MEEEMTSKTRGSLWFVVALIAIVGATTYLLYRNRSFTTTSSSRGVLNVLNWDFYIGEDTIPAFQEKYHVAVRYEKYATNEDALAKIANAPGQYDIVFPSNYMVKIMRESGRLQPINHKLVPNLVNIDPAYRRLTFDPSEFCAPYLFGSTGFAINRSFVAASDLPDADVSWRRLRDPAYKNRIVVLDDMRFVLGSALIELGFSPNTTSATELEQAVALIRSVKPNIRAFTADTGKDYLLNGDAWIAYAWSGDTLQVEVKNPNVQYVIPTAGSLRFQDGVCAVAKAPNLANAHLFINHLLDPKVSAEITNYTRYGNTNAAARRYINPDILKNPASFPPPEVMKRLQFIEDLGKNVRLYEDACERVKRQ